MAFSVGLTLSPTGIPAASNRSPCTTSSIVVSSPRGASHAGSKCTTNACSPRIATSAATSAMEAVTSSEAERLFRMLLLQGVAVSAHVDDLDAGIDRRELLAQPVHRDVERVRRHRVAQSPSRELQRGATHGDPISPDER